MRKILLSLMIVALLVVWAGPVQAAAPSPKVYVITNTTTTVQSTSIPTSIIRPGKDRVLRFKVTSALVTPSTAVEAVAALYDSATTGGALATVLEGEVESNDSDSVEEVYSRALRIANGVTIVQGAHTVVTVEWEYFSP